MGFFASCLVKTVGSFKGSEITGTGGFFGWERNQNFGRTDGSLIWNFVFKRPEPEVTRVYKSNNNNNKIKKFLFFLNRKKGQVTSQH